MFFAVVVAICLGVTMYAWAIGIEGAKELVMFLLGAVVGFLSPAPEREKIEISVPKQYRVEAHIDVKEEEYPPQ